MARSLKTFAVVVLMAGIPFVATNAAFSATSGAIYTTTQDGTVVDENIYASHEDVYLSGGPQNLNASGLPDGTYYFQITDPSGKVLLSSDPAVCRQLQVVGGHVDGSVGPACKHPNGTFNPANGTLPVKMAPFDVTPNNGNEYKAWLIPAAKATISGSDPKVLNFSKSDAKTDNFKAQQGVPQGSCQPSSSLSVLVSGNDVTSYVPKGSWSFGATGIGVVPIEGTGFGPASIPTTSVVNSCGSNPNTGETVCTANNTDVYFINGTTLDSGVSPNPMASSGTGATGFSGGACTNCGVAMDATHNIAAIGLSLSGGAAAGFQILNLGSALFDTPFSSMSPGADISEDALIDPIRNLLLSAAENNNYEIIDISNKTSPLFYEQSITGGVGVLDSSGEDCSTGIVLAPFEFSTPSQVFIADISNPAFATFTPGSPGTWAAPEQVQTLTNSFLSAGASGIAVAQGTHTGVVTGEFGGNTLTAIALPTTSGTGAVPAISNWMSCSIAGFSTGFDPHTVTAYQSPNGGDAIALIANSGATMLARVDLTAMLALAETAVGSHLCASGMLPPTVVSFFAVP